MGLLSKLFGAGKNPKENTDDYGAVSMPPSSEAGAVNSPSATVKKMRILMITSNTKKPFGGKVATIETPSFSCFISTAKAGFFQKQSMEIFDHTRGFSWHPIAKLIYNDLLDSDTRLEMHDIIIDKIDEAGMNGVALIDILVSLCELVQQESIATPEISKEWYNSQV